MTDCTLCDLPTPDPPITNDSVAGEFCCRGCLEVARHLDDVEDFDPNEADRPDSEDDADGPDLPEYTETAYLSVGGLHCSACETFVATSAMEADGVLDAQVSYATDTAKIAYDPNEIDRADLPGTISRLGYSAWLSDGKGEADETDSRDNQRILIGSLAGMLVMLGYGLVLYRSYLSLSSTLELGVLVATLVLGMVYCGVTFLLRFGVVRTAVLLPVLQAGAFTAILKADALSVANTLPVVTGLATVVVFYTGYPFLRGAYVSVRSRQPNMDFLVALAVLAAYVYSLLSYLTGATEVYFDVAVMIVLVVSLGNTIEDRVKRRAVQGLSSFAGSRITDARRRLADGTTETVPVEDLGSGDAVVVNVGERIPADGRVSEGTAAVDESLLTGEAIPNVKEPGDSVIGGTIVTSNALVVEVSDEAESTFDRLVDLLWDIQTGRNGVQRFADRLAAVFVPFVVLLAMGSTGYYLWSGTGLGTAILTGVAVLVVSCPCALGLATPLAITAGIRESVDDGIVVTDASVFERVDDVDVVVFDKTGTLTTGEMSVVDVIVSAASREDVLTKAAAIEQFGGHPAASAITTYADPPPGDVADFTEHPRGVSGTVEGSTVQVGHPTLFGDSDWEIPAPLESAVQSRDDPADLPVVVGWDGVVRGVIWITDQRRGAWKSVIEELAESGREIVVLTGDDEAATTQFQRHAAIDQVFTGVPPEGKARTVRRLQADRTVAVVGDGSNDAPALATADLGIAMASGTELAADAAAAIVTTNDLAAVPRLFTIASGTRNRIRQNLGWALTYNVVAIPLAVVGVLNPLFAAVAMAASSLIVVGNSARQLG
jgi:Cu2+-exporting ATPase